LPIFDAVPLGERAHQLALAGDGRRGQRELVEAILARHLEGGRPEE
jgi:hypothetical protein